MASQQSASFSKKYHVRTLVNAFVLIVFALVLTTQFHRFRDGFDELSKANVTDVLIAAACTVLTFFLAAGAYRLLVLRAVRYWTLLAIELAAAFANRLLPSGIGGLGLHGVFLHRQKHSVAEATAVVSTNNLLGICGHVLLLCLILLLAPDGVFASQFHIPIVRNLGVLLIIVAAIVLLLQVPRLRRAVGKFGRNLLVSFRRYVRHPQKPLLALALSMLLTLTYVTVLRFSAKAVGVELPFSSLFIVFSIGVLLGTAAPTPGGLVGVEAGLFAGFHAYNIDATPALAAILLYRLLTYLLPILPGAVMFVLVRQKRLI